MERLSGIIKWYNQKRGYGFIENGGEEYFFHISNVVNGDQKTLKEGIEVSYELEENKLKNKLQAVNVIVIE